MGRFLFFFAVTTVASSASNFIVGFAIGVLSSVLLDVFLVSSGKLNSSVSHCANASGSKTNMISSNVSSRAVNPGNGLPMMDNCFDVGGNLFGSSGCDNHLNDCFSDGFNGSL